MLAPVPPSHTTSLVFHPPAVHTVDPHLSIIPINILLVVSGRSHPRSVVCHHLKRPPDPFQLPCLQVPRVRWHRSIASPGLPAYSGYSEWWYALPCPGGLSTALQSTCGLWFGHCEFRLKSRMWRSSYRTTLRWTCGSYHIGSGLSLKIMIVVEVRLFGEYWVFCYD